MSEIKLRMSFGKKVNRQHPPVPETCLYCGSRLRKYPYPEQHGDDDSLRGDYADNAFCGLRCGYMFGVVIAAGGTRLTPRCDDDAQGKG